MSPSRNPNSWRPKWHLLYFVLAGFDLATVSISLYLNHRLVGMYTGSVQLNQEWADRLTRISQLEAWAKRANAAGNDVFLTKNVEDESAKLHAALDRFNELMIEARDDLSSNLAPGQASPLLQRLDEVSGTMEEHLVEEESLLSLYAEKRYDEAGQRMARMDRHHGHLDATLDGLRDDIGQIQTAHFRQQMRWASSLKRLEYAIAVLITLIVCGVTLYGYNLFQQVARTTKAIEEQREREALRAKHMASLGQLAAGVAHELRNPLTSIKILVQSNRADIESRGVPSEDMDIIDQEIRRMERYLRTFLDFARPPKPEPRPMKISDLVDRTCALVVDRAAQQQVELQFAPPAAPVFVQADWEQIQQLLLNLALNALDAMPHGGVLQFELAPPVNGEMELRVLDSGAGIGAQLLPQLFEPFVTNKETGVGLGLVVSRRIAEDHGGSLNAENRPEGGACFVLRLPVLREARQGASAGSITAIPTR